MHSHLFEPFCEMIDSVPVKAVIKAAEVERKMLREDVAQRRIELDTEAGSVLTFCSFLAAAAGGVQFPFPPVPVEHCAFYRKVVRKLVEAGELPYCAQEWFEPVFSQALAHALETV